MVFKVQLEFGVINQRVIVAREVLLCPSVSLSLVRKLLGIPWNECWTRCPRRVRITLHKSSPPRSRQFDDNPCLHVLFLRTLKGTTAVLEDIKKKGGI